MAVGRVSLCVLVAVVAMMVSSAQGIYTEPQYKAWLDLHRARVEAKTTTVTDTAVAASPAKAAAGSTIYVGKKGSGAEFSTLKAAVKSIKEGNTERVHIYVFKGTYTEKVIISSKQGPITIQGEGASTTIIQYDDTAESAGATSKSASVTVESDNFIAYDITFSNTSPAPAGGAVGQQAVAFLISGDFAEFVRVGFLGAQDTLYDKAGRHYFKDCYIRGSIDFVFGAGLSYYDSCHLESIATPYEGSLTAQKKTTKGQASGFSFVNCLVTGSGPIYLGRAWGAYSEVVFSYTALDAPILPVGWFDWDIPAREKTVYYGQYLCTGVGANTTGRVSWSHDLTAEEAAPFLTWDFVDGNEWIVTGL